MSADLHDTSNCPRGVRCEADGSDEGPLTVRTVVTALGVLCVTLCPPCAASGVAPPITVDTAARLVAQHRTHLGKADR